MSKKTLRQLIVEAQSAIDTFRNPDVSECQERLNEIIVAAKLGDISREHLAHVAISDGKVRVRAEYYVRGSSGSDDYEFPEFIIDADDSIKAVTLWGLDKRIVAARYGVEKARSSLFAREQDLAKVEADLAEFLASSPQIAE